MDTATPPMNSLSAQHEEKQNMSLALHVILLPLFEEMELQGEKNLSVLQTLRTAFNNAEKENIGFAQNFIECILEAESLNINMSEILLKLASIDCPEFTLTRTETEFRYLNQRSKALRTTLSRIPEQIQDRSRFLQTIKDIAAAIKDVLDAVNDACKKYPMLTNIHGTKRHIDQNKKIFIKHSKSFSDTLKAYFKDGRADRVFESANRLINQTNELMRSFKSA
ncbi:Programmed cell death protein 10-like [Oopsacas minuta]|uniref:Programmed cell death protein 10-like n=1 Tax=Oopsacas minuta TaxID=111878 RepID=A0AAV7K281_9METZ|nr:Programmed cell death protein 10-like [Oopsacas minuta]